MLFSIAESDLTTMMKGRGVTESAVVLVEICLWLGKGENFDDGDRRRPEVLVGIHTMYVDLENRSHSAFVSCVYLNDRLLWDEGGRLLYAYDREGLPNELAVMGHSLEGLLRLIVLTHANPL